MAHPLPPPGTRSNSRLLVGLAVAIGAIGLLCAGVGVIGGAGWWWNRPQLDELEVSTLTTEDVSVADGLPVEDTNKAAATSEPKAAEVVADNSSDKPNWWSPDYWTDEPATTETTTVTTVTEPSESSTTVTTSVTATPPEFVGFTADGTSFLAPNEAGVDVATAEVMLGDIADSARSASGRTEVYWVQGTNMDPNGGTRIDYYGKVVDPDDIRRVVGIKTTWTAIPGHTDVFVKCMKVHATDYETPGSCLPTQTASR